MVAGIHVATNYLHNHGGLGDYPYCPGHQLVLNIPSALFFFCAGQEKQQKYLDRWAQKMFVLLLLETIILVSLLTVPAGAAVVGTALAL